MHSQLSDLAVAPALRGRYTESVQRGYERMRAGRAVVCGLARDVAEVLPATLARLEALGRCFGDRRTVLYENDSSDGTRDLLQQWAAEHPDVDALCEDRGDPRNRAERCLRRAARMAAYRNRCRDYVAAHFADFDYVVVVDTDLAGGWSTDGLAHTFGQDGWDFVGANGVLCTRSWSQESALVQYDAWAFRPQGSYEPLSTRAVNEMWFTPGGELLPVNSCFGGLGVYRMPAYLSARYAGTDCEHVAFHAAMREAGFGRQFLNPSQVVSYGVRIRSSYRWRALAGLGLRRPAAAA